jgi:hypothetical protein
VRDEFIPLGKLEAVLRAMGHNYEAVLNDDGLVVLDCTFPGEGGSYPIIFDELLGGVQLIDLIEQIELAGVDRSAFLTHLDSIG